MGSLCQDLWELLFLFLLRVGESAEETQTRLASQVQQCSSHNLILLIEILFSWSLADVFNDVSKKLCWWFEIVLVPLSCRKTRTFFSGFGFIWRNNVIPLVIQWQFLILPDVKASVVKNKYYIFICKERTCVHYKWYWYNEVLIWTISLVLISAVI